MNTSGPIYTRYVASASPKYAQADHAAVQRTMGKFLEQQCEPAGKRPGMLLGKIQSGKTRIFIGVIAMAFDNGYDVAVVFTKNSLALAKQTTSRIRDDLYQEDVVHVADIKFLGEVDTSDLAPKLVLVVKKEDDNVRDLNALFSDHENGLAGKKVIVIDDEADITGVGYRRVAEEEIPQEGQTKEQVLKHLQEVHRQIDIFRKANPSASYLQVTATPYALYLQSDRPGQKHESVKPGFTTLVPVGKGYVGTDHFFENCDVDGHFSQCAVVNIGDSELDALEHKDLRLIKLDNLLGGFGAAGSGRRKDNVAALRDGIIGFIVGATVRHMQAEVAGDKMIRYGFIVHTETGKRSQQWQDELVTLMVKSIVDNARRQPNAIKPLFVDAYNKLAELARRQGRALPARAEVVANAMSAALNKRVGTTVVNSDQDAVKLFDEKKGELKKPFWMTVFIGGQILDRGLTISNLIGFYYGRNPGKAQQDTVLQHMRVLGYRSAEDLAVTRVFCGKDNRIALKKIHEMDVALRERLEENIDAEVVFVSLDAAGRVVPCAPSKLMLSRTTTYKPGSKDLPVGFRTAEEGVTSLIQQVEGILHECQPDSSKWSKPFKVDKAKADKILELLERTLVSDDTGQGEKPAKKRNWKNAPFVWEHTRKVVAKMSDESPDSKEKGMVWISALGFGAPDRNNPRKISRIKDDGGLSDAPDSSKTDTADMKKSAVNVPGIILLKQAGTRELGWSGDPFIWPVIISPSELKDPIIFAHEERK